MPATKTSTKDNQLYREYEKPDPDETALQRRDRRLHRDYLYRRRHLPVSGGKLKWSAEVDDVETAIDDAMERILKRDGRLSYREASDDLLRGCAAIIYYLDGGPKRLLGILRQLESWYAEQEKASSATIREQLTKKISENPKWREAATFGKGYVIGGAKPIL